MPHLLKRTRRITCCFFAALFAVGLIHLLNHTVFPQYRLGPLASVLSCSLAVAWAVSLWIRIYQPRLRNYLITVAALILLLLLLQASCYDYFRDHPDLCRRLWYGYYISLILIPYVSFLAAQCLRDGEEIGMDRQYLILIPGAILLCAGFLTNDLHQQAFVFRDLAETASPLYSYGPLFFAAVFWIAGFSILTVAVIFLRCGHAVSRRYALIPALFLLVLTGHFILLGLYGGRTEELWLYRLWTFPELCCFVTVICWEFMIQCGLIPSNTGFARLFDISSTGSLITDEELEPRFFSEEVKHPGREILQAAAEQPVMMDEDTRIQSIRIHGGRLFWEEDLSRIHQMNRSVSELNELLSEENELISAENELQEKQYRYEQQNRLYDRLSELIKPSLDCIDELMKDRDEPEDLFRRHLAEAVIRAVGIKRTANLFLICEQSSGMSIRELEYAVRESVEYLKLVPVSAAVVAQDGKREGFLYSAPELLRLFQWYQKVLETWFPYLIALCVRIREKSGAELRLEADAADSGGRDAILEKGKELCDLFRQEGGRAVLEQEDGTVFLTISFPAADEKGGESG